MKSYLNECQFKSKKSMEEKPSGVPQGSILSSLLKLPYTFDLQIFRETLGTFVDDTAIFATHEDPTIASIFNSTYTSSKNGQRNRKLRLTNPSHRT